MKALHLPILAGGDTGFLHYIGEIKKIPSLTPEEEYMLAKRMIEHKDMGAAHKLVVSHLKLVAKVAMSFKNYGLPIVELVSEGNMGLMQAVKKFDPEKGFRLSTYAVWWIKASIQEYVVKSWSLVKIGTTSAQKKLFFNLGKMKRRIQNLHNKEFSQDNFKEVATELNVSEKEVAEMNLRMLHDSSLDVSINEDVPSMIEILPDLNDNQEIILANAQENFQQQSLLDGAMKILSDRERLIINERRLKEIPTTLEDLSKIFNISKERVRQIENRAFEKLQEFVRDKTYIMN